MARPDPLDEYIRGPDVSREALQELVIIRTEEMVKARAQVVVLRAMLMELIPHG